MDYTIYPIIALFVFFALFIGILVWVISKKQTQMDEMGKMPLED